MSTNRRSEAPRQRLRAGWVVSLLLLVAVVQAAAGDEARDAVERVVKGIIEADNAGDLGRIMSFYADDAVLVPPSGSNLIGRSKIRRHYERLLEDSSFSIVNDVEDTLVSGDLAVSRGTNHVDVTIRSSGARSKTTSRYLMTLRRDPTASNTWRIVHLMWTSEEASRSEGRSVTE